MPDMVTAFANKKVWWKCTYGHSWRGKIVDRVIEQKNAQYAKMSIYKSFQGYLLCSI